MSDDVGTRLRRVLKYARSAFFARLFARRFGSAARVAVTKLVWTHLDARLEFHSFGDSCPRDTTSLSSAFLHRPQEFCFFPVGRRLEHERSHWSGCAAGAPCRRFAFSNLSSLFRTSSSALSRALRSSSSLALLRASYIVKLSGRFPHRFVLAFFKSVLFESITFLTFCPKESNVSSVELSFLALKRIDAVRACLRMSNLAISLSYAMWSSAAHLKKCSFDSGLSERNNSPNELLCHPLGCLGASCFVHASFESMFVIFQGTNAATNRFIVFSCSSVGPALLGDIPVCNLNQGSIRKTCVNTHIFSIV